MENDLRGLPRERLSLFGLDGEVFKAISFLDSIRFDKGGYPARKSGDSKPSVSTTAIILIAKRKFGDTSILADEKTEADIKYLLKNFDKDTNSWKIFGDKIPSPWVNAFCIIALISYNRLENDCVKNAVNTLLKWQNNGGWGISSESEREILVTYWVARALLYYKLITKNDTLKIIHSLNLTLEYFENYLNENVDTLNLTDCALLFQGIKDIHDSISKNRDQTRLNQMRQLSINKLHYLIQLDMHNDQTKIRLPIETGEWYTYHFHPAILPILAQNGGDASDIFKLLTWFKDNFVEMDRNAGKWEFTANREDTYTTAIALYSLFEFAKKCDFFYLIKEKFKELETRSDLLRKENDRLKIENEQFKKRCRKIIYRYFKKYFWAIIAILGAIGVILDYTNNIIPDKLFSDPQGFIDELIRNMTQK